MHPDSEIHIGASDDEDSFHEVNFSLFLWIKTVSVKQFGTSFLCAYTASRSEVLFFADSITYIKLRGKLQYFLFLVGIFRCFFEKSECIKISHNIYKYLNFTRNFILIRLKYTRTLLQIR